MKNIATLLYALMILLFLPLAIRAQGVYIPTLYNTSNGLPQQTVNATIQDKQGYLWFATSNGFSRFDGEHFTNYRLEDNDSIGLGDNFITSLREDNRRYIWLTNDNGATLRFNPDTRRFLRLPPSFNEIDNLQMLPNGDIWLFLKNRTLVRAYYDTREKLHYEQVLAYPPADTTGIVMISSDRADRVWILTNKEFLDYNASDKRLTRHRIGHDTRFFSMRKRLNLFQLGSDRGRVYIYHNHENYYTRIQLPTDDNIMRIKAYNDRQSIYMTTGDGFFLHDIKTGDILHFSATQPAPRRLESNRIGDCYVDADKNIWVTYLDSSVITCLEVGTGSLRKLHLLDRHRHDIEAHNRISIFEDRNKRIWFYAPNKALNYYDMENRELFPLILPATQNMPDFTEPTHLYVDKQRNLWLGKTNKGILKLTFKSDHFTLFSPDPADLYNPENQTQGLCIDRKGRLWMGTQDSTLHVYDAQTRHFLGYFSAQGTLTPHKCHVGQANAIVEDRKGNLWIGTDGRGLFKATPTDGNGYALTHFTHDPDNPASLPDDRITFLTEDSAGRLWIGTAQHGLALAACDAQGHFSFVHRGNGLPRYPATHRQVRSLCEDGQGHIWAATSKGLLRFCPAANPGQTVFEELNTLSTDRGSFHSNAVFYLFRAHDGSFYLATFGKGLCRFDGQAFTCYTRREGLPSDIIYTMQEDGEGNLWLATEEGLCKFDPRQGTFDTFDNRFFPSDLTFSGNDAVANGPDELLFATDRGFLAFRPASIQKEIFKPNIVLTGFSAKDQPVCDGEGYPFTFDTPGEVMLEHEQNSFNLLFRALDMNFPDRVQYAYKLEGFDDWHTVGGREPKAVYTNIPRGTYTFRVKSTNSDGRWVNNERTLRIRVQPSFWESPGGIALMAGLFLAALATSAFVVLALYKLKQRVVMERRLAEVKANVFTNLVHEMRTPFTLVVSPLENVLAEPGLSPKVRRDLEIMQKNTRRSIRLINQILDYQKIASDHMRLTVRRVELRAFFEQLLRSFSGLAESEHKRLSLHMDAPALTLWADTDKLESVFFNLLSNAFKYSPRGRAITVEVEEREADVLIRVADRGYGIPEERQAMLFNRFENFVQRHAAHLPSTGIGLSLIKELVELHQGRITVSSRVNEGSTFTVELPKGKSHFAPGTEFIMDDGDEQSPDLCTDGPASTTGTGERPTVLIVEDNAELLHFLRETFAADYRPVTAANGEEGLRQAAAHAPDLVISDIRMPVMSGTEMVRHLREEPSTSHLPVVLLTSEASIEGEIEGLGLGVEDYIAKPFNSKVLLARVQNILQRRRQLQQLVQSQLIRPESGRPDEASPDTPAEAVLPPAEQAFIRRLTDHINEHLGSPDLTVENLAREMGISRSVLFKKTKALIGLSPLELIRDLRFRKAASLLEAGEQTVTEIAFVTGFYDSHYFSKSFKQVYGVSPSDYRKGHRPE